MKKVMIGMIGCSLLALTTVRATWTSPARSSRPVASAVQAVADTTGKAPDHTIITRDTVPPTTLDTSFRYRGDSAGAPKITDTVISLADDVPATAAAKKDTAGSSKPTVVVKTDGPAADTKARARG